MPDTLAALFVHEGPPPSVRNPMEAPEKGQPGESLKVLLAHAHVGRSHRDLVGIDTTDDVVDP